MLAKNDLYEYVCARAWLPSGIRKSLSDRCPKAPLPPRDFIVASVRVSSAGRRPLVVVRSLGPRLSEVPQPPQNTAPPPPAPSLGGPKAAPLCYALSPSASGIAQ